MSVNRTELPQGELARHDKIRRIISGIFDKPRNVTEYGCRSMSEAIDEIEALYSDLYRAEQSKCEARISCGVQANARDVTVGKSRKYQHGDWSEGTMTERKVSDIIAWFCAAAGIEVVPGSEPTVQAECRIATDEEIERLAGALATTNNDRVSDYDNANGTRATDNPYRLEAYVALHTMGYKIPGLIDCVYPGACKGCPGCQGVKF